MNARIKKKIHIVEHLDELDEKKSFEKLIEESV